VYEWICLPHLQTPHSLSLPQTNFYHPRHEPRGATIGVICSWCIRDYLSLLLLSCSSRFMTLLYCSSPPSIVSLLHTFYSKCSLPPLAAHSVLSSHQRSLLQEQSYVAYSSICPTQSHTPLLPWPCWRDAIGNTILTIQSSGTTSARTASVIEFYSKLPKGPLPALERAGGLRGRYFEGKNASG
jgi:hypothetical protein